MRYAPMPKAAERTYRRQLKADASHVDARRIVARDGAVAVVLAQVRRRRLTDEAEYLRGAAKGFSGDEDALKRVRVDGRPVTRLGGEGKVGYMVIHGGCRVVTVVAVPPDGERLAAAALR